LPLRLPRQPRRLYRTNTLKQVVCQLRHPFQHGYDDPHYLGSFQRALANTFPRAVLEHQVGIMVGPTGPVQAPPTAYWRFSDLAGHWSVAVARDFVTLETTQYTQFEDFVERFGPLVATLQEVPVTVRERLGFRFVNEIRHPDAVLPTQWRRFINSDLLGMVGGDVLGDDVIHALQEIRLRETDGIIAIRHGYLGSDPTGGAPFYSLDLDYYDEVSVPLDVGNTVEELRHFHQVLKDVFETSITDELRGYLGVREVLET